MLSNRLTEGLKFSEDHRVESDTQLSGFGQAENGGRGESSAGAGLSLQKGKEACKSVECG